MIRETYSPHGPVCPYCEHEHQPDGPFFFDEESTELECEHCGKASHMTVSHSTSWTCEEIKP